MGLLVTSTHALESSGSAASIISLSSKSLPDEKEYEARCIRWITDKFFFSSKETYEMWVKKNFGSKTAFEDEWLTKMYFEYAKELPMDEVAFQKWLSAKVQSRVDAKD